MHRARRRSASSRGLERLSRADLAGLTDGLERLVVAMDIAGERPEMFFEEDGETPVETK